MEDRNYRILELDDSVQIVHGCAFKGMVSNQCGLCYPLLDGVKILP
jgi:hypothetical protein